MPLALLAVAARGPRAGAALGAAFGLRFCRASSAGSGPLPGAWRRVALLARCPSRLAVGFYGRLAKLLGCRGGCLAHLLDRRTGGLAHLLGCLPARLWRAATGKVTERMLRYLANLGGTAYHASGFAVVVG